MTTTDTNDIVWRLNSTRWHGSPFSKDASDAAREIELLRRQVAHLEDLVAGYKEPPQMTSRGHDMSTNIEPPARDASGLVIDADDVALASIAVSLKRIADALERLPECRRVVEYYEDGKTLKRVEFAS